MAGIPELDAIRVANNLPGALNAIVAVAQRIDERLTNDALGNRRGLHSLG